MAAWDELMDRDLALNLSVPILRVEKDRLRAEETDWGYLVEKGNTRGLSLPLIESVFGDAHDELGDEDFVLHERVLMMKSNTMLPTNISMRSHEEEYAEIASPMGGEIFKVIEHSGTFMPVRVLMYRTPTMMVGFPRDGEQEGFYHGIATMKGGAVYIAKLLRPEFVDGDSFIMPKNTYVIGSTKE